MPPETPGTRELLRRLIVAEASSDRGSDDPVAAPRLACERVYGRLSVWLGASGCHALFTRAVIQARAKHPALRHVVLRPTDAGTLDGIPESIRAHGPDAVAAGIEALLLSVFELLGNLIGHDMSARLIEQAVPDNTRDDEVVR